MQSTKSTVALSVLSFLLTVFAKQLIQAEQTIMKAPSANPGTRAGKNTNNSQTPKAKPQAKVAQPQHMVLSVPLSRSIDGDPIQSAQPHDASEFGGHLIYTFYQLGGEYQQQGIPTYLGSKTSKASQPSTLAASLTLTYPVKKVADPKHPEDLNGVLFSPQWSPDGRYVLFRFGDPWNSTGTHYLYVLDTQTQALKLATSRPLCYDEAFWSPDGNYIAYAEGGDIGGSSFFTIFENVIPLPLSLYVCNWRTGHEHLVTVNDTITNSFAWGAPHTLFYGVMSQAHQELLRNYWDSKLQTDWQKKHNKIAPFDLKAVSAARPDIYVYSIESKQSKLLIRDGYRPLPSHDGKRIAFFGSEEAIRNYPLNQNWQRAPGYSSLMIANRDGTGRVALDRPKTAYPLLLWEADNAHLLALKEANNQAQLDEWDVTSQQFRNILMLQAQDYEVLRGNHHFAMLSTSRDAKQVFIFKSEVTGISHSLYDLQGTLQAVELQTGTATTLIRTKNVSGLDWHDEPMPTVSTSAAQPAAAN